MGGVGGVEIRNGVRSEGEFESIEVIGEIDEVGIEGESFLETVDVLGLGLSMMASKLVLGAMLKGIRS